MNLAKYKRKFLFIVVIAIIFVTGVIWKSQSRIYEHSFSDIVNYLSTKFTLDVTACGGEAEYHPGVWGPNFLDESTIYAIETELYIPERELKFKAWFYQIGGEENIFVIKKLNEKQAKMTVDYKGLPSRFDLPFFLLRERSILNIIGKELNDFVTYGSNFQFDEVFDKILKEVKVAKGDIATRNELKEALTHAPLVVFARVGNVDSLMNPRNWPVIEVWPWKRILKGLRNEGSGFRMFVRIPDKTSFSDKHFFAKGEKYVFFLELDKKLSEMRKEKIYKQIKAFPLAKNR